MLLFTQTIKRSLKKKGNKIMSKFVCTVCGYTAEGAAPEALRESLLVIDANTGQNGLQQARVFKECVNLTAVALTKLDGSAKGAIVLAIAKDLKLPVKLVGVGEKMEDLKLFDSKEFINALFQ